MYMESYNMWSFVVFFFSLSIVFFRVIHIEHVSVLRSFYSLIIFHSMDGLPLFIRPSLDGYLSCFCLGAIVNNAAMKYLHTVWCVFF